MIQLLIIEINNKNMEINTANLFCTSKNTIEINKDIKKMYYSKNLKYIPTIL